jgi:WD40 repeat protein
MGMCCSTSVNIEKRIGVRHGSGFNGHTGKINSVAISSDNTFIISGSEDKTIRIWDVASGKLINVLEGHTSRVSSVALSKNDQFIVSGSWDKTVRLWDRVTGECIKIFCGHSYFVSSVDISPNNKYIVSSENQHHHKSPDKTARIWDVETGKCCTVLDVGSDVVSVCFSNDTQFVLTGAPSAPNSIKLWEVETGNCTFESRKCGDNVALSSDSKYIVTSNYETVRLLDVETREIIKKFEGHTAYVRSLAISANDQWVVSGAGFVDDFVRLWNVETGKQTRLKSGGATNQDIDSIVISADNKYIVSGASGWGMCLWNVESITSKHVDTANPLQ